jgi:putative ABC transport system ATP-binding protein
MALLTQLNQQGMTVVVVTHEPEVAAYASRTITFKDGRIIDDSPNKKVGSLGGLS